jgi:hypothetical protein
MRVQIASSDPSWPFLDSSAFGTAVRGTAVRGSPANAVLATTWRRVLDGLGARGSYFASLESRAFRYFKRVYRKA